MNYESRKQAIIKWHKTHVKNKIIAFYPQDNDILELANRINFQAFVKAKLNEELERINNVKKDS